MRIIGKVFQNPEAWRLIQQSKENNYGNSNDDDDNNNDIAVKDKKKRNCHLIDMNVPTRSSVKMTEKLSLLRIYIETEIEGMLGIETTAIPVVTGALGLVKKRMEIPSAKSPGILGYKKLKGILCLEVPLL